MIDGPQLRHRLEAIKNGHRYVDHEYVRIEASNLVYCVSSVIYCTNNVKILTQGEANLNQNFLVIIGE